MHTIEIKAKSEDERNATIDIEANSDSAVYVGLSCAIVQALIERFDAPKYSKKAFVKVLKRAIKDALRELNG